MNMKISVKLIGLLIIIVAINLLFSFFALRKIDRAVEATSLQHDYNAPVMITMLNLQKDIIQIQQWLTDVSATKGAPGYDDGFDEAAYFLTSAHERIGSLEKMGIDQELLSQLSENLDDFYAKGLQMANAYIEEGTDSGNAFMGKFDPFALELEGSVDILLLEIEKDYQDGADATFTTIMDAKQIYIISSVIVTSIIICVLLVVFYSVILPLKELTKITYGLAEGDGNLTSRIKVRSKDELGIIATNTNTFIEDIHQMICNLNKISSMTESRMSSVQSMTTDTVHSFEKINATIGEIAHGSNNQAMNTSNGYEKVILLGKFMEEESSRVEVLNQQFVHISQKVNKGLNVVEELKFKAKESDEATKAVNNSIINTNSSSQRISEASTLIASIAKQTNLLSLNAAIEAARAGEHGKGFAVVADEIRSLAEQSASSTKLIDDMVKALQSDVNAAVKEMSKVKEVLGILAIQIIESESIYKDMIEPIQDSMALTSDLQSSNVEMNKQRVAIQDMIQELSVIAEENAAGTEEISEQTTNQKNIFRSIATHTEEVNGMVGRIAAMVNRFEIDTDNEAAGVWLQQEIME